MSEPRSRNWKKISCIGCVGVPCMVLFLTLGFIKCQVAREGRGLEADVADLKAMGIPTEPEDLKSKVQVPSHQNAAPIYRNLDSELKKIYSKKSYRHNELIARYKGYLPEQAEYEAALKHFGQAFEVVRQLPTKPFVDFNHNYSLGFSYPFPEIYRMKQMADMLSRRVIYWLDHKDYRKAIDDIDTQLILSGHALVNADLPESLTGIRMQSFAFNSLDRLLNAVQENDQLLQQIEGIFVRRMKRPDFLRALYAEVVLERIAIRTIDSLADLEQVSHPSEPDGFQKAIDRILVDDSLRRMYEAKAVSLWKRIFANLPKVGSNWLEMINYLEKFDAQIEADMSIQNRVNQIINPGLHQSAIAFARADAYHRVALLAIKLLRQRPKGLPTDLSGFGELAIDPIDGKPMRYARIGKGFKVWSIGEDRKDNGGQPKTPTVRIPDTDIVLGYGVGFAPPERKPAGKY